MTLKKKKKLAIHKLFLRIGQRVIYFYELLIFLNDLGDLGDDIIVDSRQVEENPVSVLSVIDLIIDNHAEYLDVSFFLLYQPNASDQILFKRCCEFRLGAILHINRLSLSCLSRGDINSVVVPFRSHVCPFA